ncbi:MAG TPA: glycosyltransferase [Thermoanaerobaculia bacterium]|nr:glycosyltransferase [Thermoanaerobaculia bacterium]
MRITFLVERPTQFEAPFFRYVAQAAGTSGDEHELRVLFTGEEVGRPVFDPELGQEIAWGFDLLAGYPHAIVPARGRGRWLARAISRESCDLLIVNGYTRWVYLLAAALARRAGVPTALRLDSVLWDAAAGPGRGKPLLFSLLLLPLFDLFLGVGTLTLDYLTACGVPAERRGLFPYAVDVEHFRAASHLGADERAAARERLGMPAGSNGAKAVLAVAKLAPREAPWDLLRALPFLPGDVRLLLAGDGPARADLERLAAELGPDRVRFLGYVPYGELPALYAAADLFVHPVREERWGVSVAEALACGLPVVTSSRVGAAHDLVIPGGNGAVYPAGEPRQLAQCIAEALALDPGRIAATSRAVLARWDYPAAWRSLAEATARALGPLSGDLAG